MAEAGLSLGSNLGDKAAAITLALQSLDAHAQIRVLRRSQLYQTQPWGNEQQDWFVNACALVETELTPHVLLAACLDVERLLGRERGHSPKWGPRSIDIDVLFYEGVELAGEELTLPHPFMFERAFVLVPLSEIAPELRIGGRTVAEARAALDDAGVRPLDERWRTK